MSIDLATKLAALERRVAALEGREKRGGPFQPPTAAEVAEYCDAGNLNVDAGQFCDFYGSKGWMVGKNKMKDWRMAVRNWSRRDRAESAVTTRPQKCMPLEPGEYSEFRGW